MSCSALTRALLLALGALLAVASVAGAATLNVPAEHASLEAAYHAAGDGDTIELAAGVYGPQEIPPGTKTVTVHGAPGNKLRQLINHADNITFDGLDIDAGMTTPNGAAFEAMSEPGGHNVTFKHGRIGNVVDQKGAVLGGSTDGTPVNLLIDDVEFHDVIQVGPGVHNECVFSQAGGLTIRNSTFTNCATMDLFIVRGDWWGQALYGGVTLENNVFGHSVLGSGWHYYGLYWSNGSFTNARVVNNTFESSVILSNPGPGPYSGVWANNIGGGWDCLPGVTYRGNIGTRCHASDTAVTPASSCAPPACPAVTVPVGWSNPAAHDFRLTAGSIAIDHGDPAYAPALDHTCRPRDARPDAGAYEYGAGAQVCSGAGSPGEGGAGDDAGRNDPADGDAGGTPTAVPPPVNPPAGSAGPSAGAPTVRSARLGSRTLCRRPRSGCPAATQLRLSLAGAARVSVRVERSSATGRAARTVAVVARKATSVRIAVKGLRPGRYRVRVVAIDAAGRRSKPKTLSFAARR